MARTLILDIETSYIEVLERKWGLYDERPISREIINDWQVLCFAYAWEDEVDEDGFPIFHQVSQHTLPMYKPGVNNDFMVIAKYVELANQADLMVAHNGDKFDFRKLNARIAAHGLPVPPPVPQVDTKKIAKKYFGFTSNKLDDLAQILGVTRKTSPGGMGTWDGCMAGDPKSWKLMNDYCENDTKVLYEIYCKLKPWHTSHPHIGLIDNGNPDTCESCGSSKLVRRGTRYTNRRRYQRLRCECGHWQKGRLIR